MQVTVGKDSQARHVRATQAKKKKTKGDTSPKEDTIYMYDTPGLINQVHAPITPGRINHLHAPITPGLINAVQW